MITLNLEELQKHLKKHNYDAKVEKEKQQISIPLKLEGTEFPLFIKTDGNSLQLIILLPCRIQPRAMRDTARLLHKLNTATDLPGFGMDETEGISFYRITIPTVDGKIHPDLFNRLFITVPQIAFLFFPVINTVASGVTLELIEPSLKEALKKFSVQNSSPKTLLPTGELRDSRTK